MKREIFLLVLLALLFSAFAVTKDFVFRVPQNWPQPEYDFSKNPLSSSTIQLGRALFYDPQLSRNNSVSCASCHSPYNAFTHADHALSHGIEDRIGTRNSPALMNLAWQKSFMWDGAVNHLDMQALAPISHPDEMGEKLENIISKLQNSGSYRNLFYTSFADSTITGEHLLKALSQFMLTLVSSESKYDSVMRGQAGFTNQENNGYSLYKKNCAACHTEPLFSNFEFENNGLMPDTTLNDLGRMKITHLPVDSLKFKVPTLRNLEYSFPYMHDGRFKTLKEVLKHYTTGIKPGNALSVKLPDSIVISPDEKVDLISFLLTLTDRKFIFDPSHSYPKEILNSGANGNKY